MDTKHAQQHHAAGAAQLTDWLIRDLVDAYPETLTVLGPLGIDLCCGGGHPLGEALALHGIDRGAVLPRIADLVAADGAPSR
jgi:iron-sulfur cluster repair protein YtfE (RIC family)